MSRNTRTLAIVIYMGLMTAPIEGKPAKGANDLLEKTLDAIMQVESGGRDHAVGDNGRALGAYQIHRAYWTEGTRFLGVSWPYSEAVDRAKARMVVLAYLTHYAGPGASWEQMARVHNGGPNGAKKAATKAYWLKIQKAMKGAKL